MKKQLDQIAEFHKKISSPVLAEPSFIPQERAEFRYQLMKEEVEEYLAGVKDGNLPNIAKELADILCTVYGTILEHGLQDKIEAVFDEVHRSNMSKDASSGKGIKGEGYSPANIEQFF